MTYYKSEFFRIDEYKCRCGCGLCSMHDNALKSLDKIRTIYGKPMAITSGCRCEKHNKEVGGAKSSAHLPQKDKWCYAVDIKCDNSEDRFKLIQIAYEQGCVRIGIHKDFIHLDFSPYLPQKVVWLYA